MTELYSDATDPEAMAKRLQKLERQVLALKTALSLEAASVGAGGTRWHSGGGITIEDGGDIEVDDGGNIRITGGNLELTSTDGETGLAFLGNIEDGTRVWAFAFKDGGTAVGLAGPQDASFWFMNDSSGNQVMSSDALSGTGLARPHLQMWMAPSFDAEQDGTKLWPSTPSGTAVKLMQGINTIWNPRLTIGVLMGGAGGVGHWRLDIGGTTVLADETSTGVHIVDIPGWGDTVAPGDGVGIDLYGWVTSGPGRVYLQVDRLHGTQS